MRDFSDSQTRPFSKAKDDDLVDLIRGILDGATVVKEPENEEPEKDDSENKKPKSKRAAQAANRIRNKKEKETDNGNKGTE